MLTYFANHSEAATLTTKGQITIPLCVREALGVQQGDRILFVPDANGTYRIQAQRNSHNQLAGSLHNFAHVAYSEESAHSAITEKLRQKFLP